MVTQTSIQAYLKQIEMGKQNGDKDRLLFWAIKQRGGFISPTAVNQLKIKRETITARLAELQDCGIIYVISHMEFNGYNHSIYAVERDPKKCVANAHNRRLEKFKQWKKRGEQFADLM